MCVFSLFIPLVKRTFQSWRLNQSRSSGDPWRAPEFLRGASGDRRGLIPEPPLLRVCVSVGVPRLDHHLRLLLLCLCFWSFKTEMFFIYFSLEYSNQTAVHLWFTPDHRNASWSSVPPGWMQTCVWWHYHEKALPRRGTYLTSDLPFVPPRQQIGAVVAVGPLAAWWLKRHEWVVGGSLEQVFQVHVDSHTPPPWRHNNIQRHTQQTGWRNPSLQPFLGTLLPSAPPFLVWGLLKRGAPMEGALLVCMWDLHVCICVVLEA